MVYTKRSWLIAAAVLAAGAVPVFAQQGNAGQVDRDIAKAIATLNDMQKLGQEIDSHHGMAATTTRQPQAAARPASQTSAAQRARRNNNNNRARNNRNTNRNRNQNQNPPKN